MTTYLRFQAYLINTQIFVLKLTNIFKRQKNQIEQIELVNKFKKRS